MRCYLCLGSNQGNPEENLVRAAESICRHENIRLHAVSSVYKTEPQGDKNQQWFANQVIAVDYETSGSLAEAADNLMQYLLGIEAGMGRVRDEARRFGPRVIDIDIIAMEDNPPSGQMLSLQTKWVTVPHPRVLERAFVLIPLQEIAPHISINSIPTGKALEKLAHRLEGNKIFQ